MLLKYAVGAACMAVIASAMTKEEFDAARDLRMAARDAAKAKSNANRNEARGRKRAQMEARLAEIAAKDAERQAKQDEWWARVSKIIQKDKEKAQYAATKALQQEQKENYALQKVLDRKMKLEQNAARKQQWLDRQVLKELRKVQKEAWKLLNAQQKAVYEQLDAQQKDNWQEERDAAIEAFNRNIDEWETEDERQKAVWDRVMAHQQIHWAAKVAGIYQEGSNCILPGSYFNPLANPQEGDEDFDPDFDLVGWSPGTNQHGIDVSSYDEMDTHFGMFSFARSEGGSFYVLVSTDSTNNLYEIQADGFPGQEGMSAKMSYSEHSKARNFGAIDNVGSGAGSYNIKMLSIADTDGSNLNWAMCQKA